MAKVVILPAPEDDAVGLEQPRAPDLPLLDPARRPVGGDPFRLARPQDRHRDRDGDRRDAPGGGGEAAFDENVVGVGVRSEPPPEERRRLVDRLAEDAEPGRAELRLKPEPPRRPLRRRPQEGKHDGADKSTWPQRILVPDMRQSKASKPSLKRGASTLEFSARSRSVASWRALSQNY